jgi:hypothetical protein
MVAASITVIVLIVSMLTASRGRSTRAFPPNGCQASLVRTDTNCAAERREA